MKSKRFITFFSCATVCLAAGLIALIISDQIARADSGDGGNLGNCAATGYCTRYGGAWFLQSLGEFQTHPEWQNTGGENKAQAIAACSKYGADTQIYRLSFVYYNGDGTFNAGKYSGLVSNSTLGYNYISGIGVNIQSVQAAFRAAEANGATQTTWENTAWFCYRSEWGGGGTPVQPLKSGFYSSSTVSFNPNGIGNVTATAKDESSGDERIKNIYFSIESYESTANVTFNHTLHYKSGGFSLSGDDKLVRTFGNDSTSFSNVKTTWSISGQGYSPASGGSDWSTSATGDGASSGVLSQTVPVSVATPGQTVTVCSRVNYQSRSITFSGKEHEVKPAKDPSCNTSDGPSSDMTHGQCNAAGGSWSPAEPREAHTDYTVSYGGDSGYSEVCAHIYRNVEPTGGPVAPTGTTANEIMFSGESSNITWDTHASAHDTRRIVDGQAVAFHVPANVSESNKPTTGDSRDSHGPCSHYGNNCKTIESGKTSSYNASAAIKVPNDVGTKYCHSFGYHFRTFYGISSPSGINWSETGNYWHNYDAVCRTIAKKPSVAIWNSGLLTNGGVKVSKSQRYDMPTFGEQTNAGNQSQHLYGSWTEYLSAINLGIQNFSSGSALARGSDKFSLLDNSALTITNRNAFKNNTESLLGYSGITTSSTLHTRLNTFLRSRATPIGDTLGPQINLTGTHIWQHTGDLNIDGNITTHPGNYTSIYQIPQVIIFVDGNVNVSSNVDRIDAWIIASGEVNTCREFAYSSTQSDSGNIHINPCTQQLVFNAPVLASRLKLNRSYGSDPTLTRRGTFGTVSGKETPAEVFNLREDVYLWAYAQAGRYDSSYTESYSRELAPRY